MSERRFPTIDKLYNYIDRVLIGVLAGYISFSLLRTVPLPFGVNYFLTALIVVISILVAGLVSVVLIVGMMAYQFIKNNTLLGVDLLAKPDPMELTFSVLSLVFLLVIPVLSYAKYLDLSSYVISLGVIASLIGTNVNYLVVELPVLVISIFFAITQRKPSLASSLISPLPAFTLFFLNFDSPDRDILLLGILLMEIASVMSFELKGGIAMISAVPPIISSFLFSVAFSSVTKDIAILSSIMSIAGIATYVGYSYSVSTLIYKNELALKKKSLVEDLNEALKGLKDLEVLKSDNFPVANDVEIALTKLEEINKEIQKCDSPKCIDDLRTKMEDVLHTVSTKVNEIIFEKIITFNEVTDQLKSKGFVMEKIDIPKDELKINSNTTYTISKILSQIEREYNTASQSLLRISEKLREITGIELQYDMRVIPDANKLPVFYDKLVDPVIMEKINNCLDGLLLLLQSVNEMKEEGTRDVEIFKSIIDSKQLKGINKINSAYDTMKRGMNYAENFVNDMIQQISPLMAVYPFLKNAFEIEVLDKIKQSIVNPTIPMCRKITLLSSSISILSQANDLLRYKDYIKDVDSILNNVKTELQSEENECLTLEELGIKKEIAFILNAKIKAEGNGIKMSNSQICKNKSTN